MLFMSFHILLAAFPMWACPPEECTGDSRESTFTLNVEPGQVDGGLMMFTLCPPEDDEDGEPGDTGVSDRSARRSNPYGFLTGLAYRQDKGDEPAEEGDDHPIKEGGPWLGVKFGAIPEALSAHLRTDDGMLILNIAKDSPADRAGLEQYDVVRKLDGRSAGANVHEFIEALKEFKVGGEVKLGIVRGGKDQVITVELGARPSNLEQIEYKYDEPAESQMSQIQQVTPWFYGWKDGQLVPPDAEGLKAFELAIPHLRQWRMQPDGGFKSFSIIRSEDGESIEIRSEGDGRITVKRSDKDGDNVETKTFDSADDLKKDDPEAFKLYSQNSEGRWYLGGRQFRGFEADDYSKHFEEALKLYRDKAGQVERQMEEATKQLERRYGPGSGRIVRQRVGASFERLDDGSIKVTIREGDDEIVETYDSEKSLKRERPDLFDRYKKMRAKDEQSQQEE